MFTGVAKAYLLRVPRAAGEAKVHEVVVPDWNLGTGAARHDAKDRFIEEVAAPLREGRAHHGRRSHATEAA
jgi:hypothetical protein